MVGSDQDNSNSDVTDPDVVWMIDELHGYMGTFCKRSDMASTKVRNLVGALSYIQDRGYNNFAIDNVYSFFIWKNAVNQVKDQNPPILNYDSSLLDGDIDHSAVIYEITDDWFSGNDSVCLKLGWQFYTYDCFSKAAVSPFMVTKIIP